METDATGKTCLNPANVPINVLLKYALDNLYGVQQWTELRQYDSAAKHYNRAEYIIEIVEAETCGSVGGFADGQRVGPEYTDAERVMADGFIGYEQKLKYSDRYENLFARFMFLVDRHGLNLGQDSMRLNDVMPFYRK